MAIREVRGEACTHLIPRPNIKCNISHFPLRILLLVSYYLNAIYENNLIINSDVKAHFLIRYGNSE